MSKHALHDEPGTVLAQNVAACVRTLNHSIGELARCYGSAAVVAALTEVMGCAACIDSLEERGRSIRALVERMASVGRRD